MNTETRLGFFAGLGAFFIWGSLPLYIRLMQHIGAADLLAHRVVWSIPTALIFIAIAANWRDVRTALKWAQLIIEPHYNIRHPRCWSDPRSPGRASHSP